MDEETRMTEEQAHTTNQQVSEISTYIERRDVVLDQVGRNAERPKGGCQLVRPFYWIR